jgi:hypothetical protein
MQLFDRGLLPVGSYGLVVTGASWTTGHAKSLVFKDFFDKYYVLLSIDGTGANSTSQTITISGLTFSSARDQAIAGGNNASTTGRGLISAGGSNIVMGGSAANTGWQTGGFAELESKPSFVE